MCRMFGVLSLAYVAIFMLTVVHCEEDLSSNSVVDFFNKGIFVYLFKIVMEL